MDDFTRNKRVIIKLSCSHIYCRKCLRTYALTILQEHTYPVKCPHPRCQSLLDLTGQLKGLVGQNYIKAAQTKEISNLCPRNNCRGTLVDGKCNVCSDVPCFDCGEIHMGECNKDIKASYELLKRETKKCPNCKVPITKTDGCDHMICRQCKTNFSWNSLSIDPDVWNRPPVLPPMPFLQHIPELQLDPRGNLFNLDDQDQTFDMFFLTQPTEGFERVRQNFLMTMIIHSIFLGQ